MSEYKYRSSGLDTAVSSALDTFTKLRTMRNERERMDMERERMGMERERLDDSLKTSDLQRQQYQASLDKSQYELGLLKDAANREEQIRGRTADWHRAQSAIRYFEENGQFPEGAFPGIGRPQAGQPTIDPRTGKPYPKDPTRMGADGKPLGTPTDGVRGESLPAYIAAYHNPSPDAVADARQKLANEKGIDLAAFSDPNAAQYLYALNQVVQGKMDRNNPTAIKAINLFFRPGIRKGVGGDIVDKELAASFPTQDSKGVYVDLGVTKAGGSKENNPMTVKRGNDDEVKALPMDDIVQTVMGLNQLGAEIMSNQQLLGELKRQMEQARIDVIGWGGSDLGAANPVSIGKGAVLYDTANKRVMFENPDPGTPSSLSASEQEAIGIAEILQSNGIEATRGNIERYRQVLSTFSQTRAQYEDFVKDKVSLMADGDVQAQVLERVMKVANDLAKSNPQYGEEIRSTGQGGRIKKITIKPTDDAFRIARKQIADELWTQQTGNPVPRGMPEDSVVSAIKRDLERKKPQVGGVLTDEQIKTMNVSKEQN